MGYICQKLGKLINSKIFIKDEPNYISVGSDVINSLKYSFMTSGFKDILIERMNVSSDFNSPNDFTTFTSETADPLQKMRANQFSISMIRARSLILFIVKSENYVPKI